MTSTRDIGEDIIRTKTGHSSEEWFTILDRFDAKAKGKLMSIHLLREEYQLSLWWAQTIVVRYAWARGITKGF